MDKPKTQVQFYLYWQFIFMIALWFKETKYGFGTNGEDEMHSMELWTPLFYFNWRIEYVKEGSLYWNY